MSIDAVRRTTETGLKTPPRRVPVSSVAAATFAAAGALHLFAAITHVPMAASMAASMQHSSTASASAMDWGAAMVLAILGVLQVLLAGALWTAPFTSVMMTAIAVNVGALALYVVSRAAALPFGQHGGAGSDLGLLDLAVAALEVAGVVALTICLPTHRRSTVTTGLLVVGLCLVGGRLTGILAA
jgi:hypothetical protein